MDINEIKRISNILEKKKRLDDIDLQAANCIYNGHTVFSIFNEYDKMMEQLLTQLDEGEWEPEVQEDESEVQNDVLRRLFRILTLPTPVMESPSAKDTPAIEKQPNL